MAGWILLSTNTCTVRWPAHWPKCTLRVMWQTDFIYLNQIKFWFLYIYFSSLKNYLQKELSQCTFVKLCLNYTLAHNRTMYLCTVCWQHFTHSVHVCGWQQDSSCHGLWALWSSGPCTCLYKAFFNQLNFVFSWFSDYFEEYTR